MTIHSLHRALKSSGIGQLIPLLLTLLTMVIVGGGCARRRSEPPDAAAFALPPDVPQNHKLSSKSAGATSKNLDSVVPASWSHIAQTWFSKAIRRSDTRLDSKTGVLPARREVVSIDVAALARRHPAWQLANALQSEQTVLLPFSPIDAPGVPVWQQALGSTASGSAASGSTASLPPLRMAPRFTFSGSGFSPGFFQPEMRVTATGFDVLESNARRGQNQALAAFMEDATVAQNASLKTRRLSLEGALEDDIAVSQRLALADLEPSLLSNPIQLEMTNLRLRLLENLYATEPERAAAEQRLRTLEAQWEENLQQQEVERLAELTRLRTEIPQRLRGEGGNRIALELDAARRRYAAARQAVAEVQSTRIAQDFTAEENPLGIVLPGASLPPQRLGTRALMAGGERSGRNKSTPSGEKAGIIETVRVDVASTRPFNSFQDLRPFAVKSTAPSKRAAHIRALRTIALSDARRWAQSAALRAGWEWKEDARDSQVATPDRTREVLRLLNLH